jgi:hypothetical protein
MADKSQKKLNEKQVVDYIIENWDRLFDDLKFYKREYYWLEDWRCDISAYVLMDLKDIGIKEESYIYRAPVFIECKYKSDARDLLLEMRKAMTFVKRCKWPAYIGVFMDNYDDPHILDFLIENEIHMWKIDIKDDDLSTLKMVYYEPEGTVIED